MFTFLGFKIKIRYIFYRPKFKYKLLLVDNKVYRIVFFTQLHWLKCNSCIF